MGIKDNFTADEWFKVMTGPGRAGAAVVAASPSGLTGLVAEAQAIGQAVRERQRAEPHAAAGGHGGRPAGHRPDPQAMPHQERARNMEEAREQSLQGVRQAAWLVSAKASPRTPPRTAPC